MIQLLVPKFPIFEKSYKDEAVDQNKQLLSIKSWIPLDIMQVSSVSYETIDAQKQLKQYFIHKYRGLMLPTSCFFYMHFPSYWHGKHILGSTENDLAMPLVYN